MFPHYASFLTSFTCNSSLFSNKALLFFLAKKEKKKKKERLDLFDNVYIVIGLHSNWTSSLSLMERNFYSHLRKRERVQKAAIFEFQATILKLKVLSFFYG